ncbi:hypothetical protein DL765_004370 [Monosporascus sp. GIB2]|nr:hypothetical protein DL765_004370 [Monosporascus sp. GIB2]
MRFFTLFLSALPLFKGVSAMASDQSTPLEWGNSTGPMGGNLITDPNRLSVLYAMHDETIHMLNEGDVIPLERSTNLTDYNQHDKRQYQVFGLLGVLVASRLPAGALQQVLGALLDLFVKDDVIWTSTENCRARFSTQGGGNEHIETLAKGHRNPTADEWRNVGWNNPENTSPPVHFFEGDPAIGLYSVQFTATDRVAWGGIPGTERCKIEGLCNPQYIFYHRGYRVILNTWQSQGRISACQYSHGEQCLGMCQSGVKDQFSSGGVRWGGDCAIPCVNDIPDDYIVVPNEEGKFMVVGDSISHGMEADWTWRYRLSQWLDHNGYIHKFVGPWEGTHGNKPIAVSQPHAPLFPNEEVFQISDTVGSYAGGVAAGFRNSGHASYWGRQAAQSRHTIKDWVSSHKPDYLLILLGFNDLGWFVSGPEDLLGDMGNLIQAAREAKPDIKLLVGNVVHRTFIKGRQDLVDNTNRYNILLRDTIPSWFRWESPIAYVDVNTDYNCRPGGCPDGYDGLHPNALGEYHIAQAFARVLKRDFGYNGVDFRVPAQVDPRPVGTPQNVVTVAYPEGLFTTWDPVYNSRGYEIRARLQGATGWWSEGIVYPSTHGSWQTWIINGQTWEYQVRTKGDNDARSDWSSISSATANLRTAPGPSNIIVEPQGNNVLVRWDAVTGYYVNRYEVIVWDKDTEDAFIVGYPAAGTSLVLTDLKPGHRHGIWVSTHVGMIGSLTRRLAAPGGLPTTGRAVRPGSGAPAPPTGLRVHSIDATTIRLEWDAVPGAAGYGVYDRSVRDNTALKLGATTMETSYGISYLFPGNWNFEFCVSAFNGNLETAPVACVIPPVCCGHKKRDVVSGNYTLAQNVSTAYDATSVVEDAELQELYTMYRQTAEYASFLAPEHGLIMPGEELI